MLIFKRRPKASESGQSLVEAAFGLALLLFMFAGLIDLGRVYFTYVALEGAAGEAALYLSIYPQCPGDGTDDGTTSGTPVADNTVNNNSAPYSADCDPPNNAVWRAEEAGGGIVDWSNVAIVAVRNTIPGVGERVDVSITYPYDFILPFIPEIAGATSINLVAKTSQTIVTE